MKKYILASIALVSLGSGILVSSILFDNRPLELDSITWLGTQARALPEFQLYDHDNQLLGNNRLTGKWSLMFFGYTHCPDICPASLQVLAETMEFITDRKLRESLQVIFVSVDPDRDSREILKTYVQYCNVDFIGASAQIPQLNILTAALGIAHEREKTSENQQAYGVSHSSAIILTNPAGEFAGLISAPHDSQAMASDLRKIIASS